MIYAENYLFSVSHCAGREGSNPWFTVSSLPSEEALKEKSNKSPETFEEVLVMVADIDGNLF